MQHLHMTGYFIFERHIILDAGKWLRSFLLAGKKKNRIGDVIEKVIATHSVLEKKKIRVGMGLVCILINLSQMFPLLISKLFSEFKGCIQFKMSSRLILVCCNVGELCYDGNGHI